ncbi:hypothetical protein LCGC14_1543450 [marine sediment metagenome]|uniref:Uncharacterized protein n=1 Tax=marine sediment metagenome TaxID=412755 RepID=A0A0F9LT78_9ZZZZ
MKGYRTIAFQALMLIVAIFGISKVSPENIETAVTAGATLWALGNLIFRAITNSSIFTKEPK